MKLFSHTLLALCLPFGMTSLASALAPMVLTHPESQMIQTGASTTLSVVVDVSGPLTYQWKKGGVDLPSSNSPTYALSNAQGTNAGSYTVVVSNADGSCEAGPAAVFVGTRRTVFVRATATGSNNGTSWTNAYTSLTTALSNALDGDDIWVAAGTYKPSTTSNRDATFTVAKFVRLFGGFNGTETALQQRNWNANVTTLSGDLSGNDTGLGGNQGDNSKRVVTISSTPGAVVDGFTIRGGSNTVISAPDYGMGIGVLSINSSMRVKNCAFRWNNAVSYGGALGHFLGNASSPLIVESCSFIQNAAPANGGGAIEVSNAQLLVKDSYFAENTGSGSGAVTVNNSRGLVVVNSVFASNAAGGGMQAHVGAGALRGWSTYNANYRIYGCTMRNNTNTRGAEGAVSLSTSASSGSLFANSIVVGSGSNPVAFPLSNYLLSDQTISGTGNIVGTPLFVNAAAPLGADGIFGNADDGLALQPGSPGINAGIDSLVPAAITLDAAGWPRLLQQVDAGAYEHPQIANGDFELPALSIPDNLEVVGDNLQGWTRSGTGMLVLLRNLAAGVLAPKSGAQHLLFNSGDNPVGAKITTTIPTVVGGRYTVQFFVGRVGPGGGNMGITAEVRGTSPNILFSSRFEAPAGQIYGSVSQFTFTATSEFSRLSFEDTSLATVSVDVLLDSVAVKALTSIVDHPQSLNVAVSAEANFGVKATGSGTLTYQWQKDGVDIPGATSSTFSLANAKPWHIGDYTVKVTDANGTITSNAATLSLTGINSGIWKGLMAYYPFIGSPNDLSFSANHLTVSGAVLGQDRNGSNNAYSFQSDGSALFRSNSTGPDASQSQTIAAWIKPHTLSGISTIFGLSNDFDSRFFIFLNNNQIVGAHGNDSNYQQNVFTEGTLTVNKWYHVVLTSAGNSSSLACYINGTKVGEGISGTNNSLESGFWIVAGSDVQSGYVRTFQGVIDDCRIYNRSLTGSEIGALYAAENAPNNWRQTHFGSTSNAGDAADDADPDRDGLKNLLEYALNLPPNAASRVPASVQATGGNLEYLYDRSTAAFNGGTTYQVEWSDDLTIWSGAGVVETLLSDDGTTQQVKATLPAGSGGRRFVRLRVQ